MSSLFTSAVMRSLTAPPPTASPFETEPESKATWWPRVFAVESLASEYEMTIRRKMATDDEASMSAAVGLLRVESGGRQCDGTNKTAVEAASSSWVASVWLWFTSWWWWDGSETSISEEDSEVPSAASSFVRVIPVPVATMWHRFTIVKSLPANVVVPLDSRDATFFRLFYRAFADVPTRSGWTDRLRISGQKKASAPPSDGATTTASQLVCAIRALAESSGQQHEHVLAADELLDILIGNILPYCNCLLLQNLLTMQIEPAVATAEEAYCVCTLQAALLFIAQTTDEV